jgi:hypothetical protein
MVTARNDTQQGRPPLLQWWVRVCPHMTRFNRSTDTKRQEWVSDHVLQTGAHPSYVVNQKDHHHYNKLYFIIMYTLTSQQNSLKYTTCPSKLIQKRNCETNKEVLLSNKRLFKVKTNYTNCTQVRKKVTYTRTRSTVCKYCNGRCLEQFPQPQPQTSAFTSKLKSYVPMVGVFRRKIVKEVRRDDWMHPIG